jgi:(E)-4-hydroxy-3-methylbut-2-enyl-diphosphate synthase
MTRYGNTPEGMVRSALEFIFIFRSENFNNLVLSMKSSDTAVMVEANRKLVKELQIQGLSYPIHLGVTEAGEGEDGRVRSAAGIGALLSEGTGDTIRVSLSEDPEYEIPVAKEIVRIIGGSTGRIVDESSLKLSFKIWKDRYIPEVISEENGKYLDENGNLFTGKILSFEPGSKLSILSGNKERILINPRFNEDDPVKLAIDAAAITGKYFILRQADGICISNTGKVKTQRIKDIAFSILQATEARITRNRYISCPTCGRTKFNLQEAVKKVKEATGHLTGLKIAVMGCIVNGPGEMAGADYGYVGAGEGKVHIYRGTKAAIKNVPEREAVETLLSIINSDEGRKDPLSLRDVPLKGD